MFTRRTRPAQPTARRGATGRRNGTRSIHDVRAERAEVHRYFRAQLGIH